MNNAVKELLYCRWILVAILISMILVLMILFSELRNRPRYVEEVDELFALTRQEFMKGY